MSRLMSFASHGVNGPAVVEVWEQEQPVTIEPGESFVKLKDGTTERWFWDAVAKTLTISRTTDVSRDFGVSP